MVYDRWVIGWLAWLLEGLPADLLLLPGGLATLRWVMGYIGTMIGTAALSLTPASLRAGGATQHVQTHQNVPLLMHICRWRNVRSLEHYLQEAVAYLAMQTVSASVTRRIEQLANLWSVFDAPPRKRWYRFFSRVTQFDASSSHLKRLLRELGVQL